MLNKKTKTELIDMIEELDEKCEKLETDVDYWYHEYQNMCEQCDHTEYLLDCEKEFNEHGIRDIDNFIFEMKKDDVYSDEIQEFINHYLKYHND